MFIYLYMLVNYTCIFNKHKYLIWNSTLHDKFSPSQVSINNFSVNTKVQLINCNASNRLPNKQLILSIRVYV